MIESIIAGKRFDRFFHVLVGFLPESDRFNQKARHMAWLKRTV
ncbi:hypothetical protein ALQ57_102466 [Pseudomonas amygdali pv. hibisci]|uniref:Uncharacterized protein n=2 Tax=Pseudomonas amygdali TaxID=47877 RepID=A0AAX1VST9_PSEAJ|nr:hypothetical protein ALO67_102439 [Pseudomonas amygdali pv. hibisci]KPY76225.1 hypothetical protein ALO60_102545 [Pseudomonas amygdali pv. tabaci]RML77536.1 hypothetical protein ALQ89_04048 [Pseudomonas amygdali pv. tabaci]RMN56360.1 hypothetical protein ALQ57_102466 [Pseudomonas amygdali pv. hibisci]RMR92086.1 hypothetical protein ALP77_102434 [Pseudomonas amygdali pv. tabaci]